jgi:hypothetical protein
VVAYAFPAFCAAAPVPAGPSRPSIPPPTHILLAQDNDAWVSDTVLLSRKLAFAHRLGYDGFICHLSPPPPAPRGAAPSWVRGPGTDCRWRLAGPSGAGRPGARQDFIDKARSLKRISERAGLAFIPKVGDIGWGYQYVSIDPGTLAGEYLEMRIPETPENLFAGEAGLGAVTRENGWGDAAGSQAFDTAAEDRGRVSLSLRRAGLYSAHWRIDAPWDGYLRCRFRIRNGGGAGDTAVLNAYALYPGRPHIRAFRLLASSRARPGKAPADLGIGFFAKRGRVYYLDLEYHSADPKGGRLEADQGWLGRAVPPRTALIDTRGYEARPGPGLPSCLEYLAAHGNPEEAGMRTLISSRSPPLADTPWFDLDGPRADSAWSSLTAIRADFRDGSPEAALRFPIDPFAPASRQITAEILDALAEAMGPGMGYVHLGADEAFSLGRSRRQSRPSLSALGPAGIYARIVRERIAQADSAFAGRFPGKPLPTYLLFGDMLSRMNGIEEGTLSALDTLATAPALRGRIILMPWYYSDQLASPPFPLPGPVVGGPPEAAFLGVLREEGDRLGKAGFDYIGFYSTEGSLAGLKQQSQGAEAWAKACAERAKAKRGRCLGLAYSGWDTVPKAGWGRNYNGMLLLSRSWGGGPALEVDADGDGVLDSLRGSGPFPR